MDLTQTFPRSVRETFCGVVMLARTADKARAVANGTNGEYHYNCPMDQTVFGFLGIDPEQFLAKVKIAPDDAEVEQFVKEFTGRKKPAEIEAFNKDFLAQKPASGSDAATSFEQLRASVAPERTDVTTWADLLDLDEKRSVPVRAAAAL